MNKIYKTQDPKYGIKNNRLVNMKTGIEIPEDELVFMLRAKDINAESAIFYYSSICCNENHRKAVMKRVINFHNFKARNRYKTGEPNS